MNHSVNPTSCTCGNVIAVCANEFAAHFNQLMPGITGAAIRKSISEHAIGCNGKLNKFATGVKSSSHIQRCIFPEDVLKRLDCGTYKLMLPIN